MEVGALSTMMGVDAINFFNGNLKIFMLYVKKF